MSNTQRTKFTPDMLKENISILQDIIDVCNEYAESGASWSQICNAKNLNPAKTRNTILNLYRCSGACPPLDETKMEDIYDGYEQFYRCMFGEHQIERASLPYDYKESVLYVIQNAPQQERETDVLMRRFGIGKYAEPETLEEIGKDLDRTKNTIHQIEAKALRYCHRRQYMECLRVGIAKYNLLQEQAKEQQKLEEEHAKEEHAAFMKAMEQEHQERMKNAESGPVECLHKMIDEDLKETDINALPLSVRSYNALKRYAVCTLYDLLKIAATKELLKVRNLGVRSGEEVRQALDKYANEKYGMTAANLREICFGGEE